MEASKTTKEDSKSSDGKVEITFWDNYADTIHTEIYDKLISDFEEENPDITVKYVPLPQPILMTQAVMSKTLLLRII